MLEIIQNANRPQWVKGDGFVNLEALHIMDLSLNETFGVVHFGLIIPPQQSWGGILDSPCSSVRPSAVGVRMITQTLFIWQTNFWHDESVPVNTMNCFHLNNWGIYMVDICVSHPYMNNKVISHKTSRWFGCACYRCYYIIVWFSQCQWGHQEWDGLHPQLSTHSKTQTVRMSLAMYCIHVYMYDNYICLWRIREPDAAESLSTLCMMRPYGLSYVSPMSTRPAW